MSATTLAKTVENPSSKNSSSPLQAGAILQEPGAGWRRRVVACATRLYPFYSGCGSMGNCKLVRMLVGKNTGLDWVRLRQGPYLRVMLGDYLSNTVYFSREWDPKISWACERLLRPGDVALDIGANLGLVTCQMAALVGACGHVYSFEPNPMMTNLLEQSLQRNGYSHVTLYPMALGDAECELLLTIPYSNQCLATLVRNEEGIQVRVPVTTLSRWFARTPLSHIRLMKIDVEGFEEPVFEGAEELFRNAPPDAVIFEMNGYDGPFAAHPSVQFLRRHEYDFLMLPRKLWRMKARRFADSSFRGSPSNDLVAARRGTTFQEIANRLRASSC